MTLSHYAQPCGKNPHASDGVSPSWKRAAVMRTPHGVPPRESAVPLATGCGCCAPFSLCLCAFLRDARQYSTPNPPAVLQTATWIQCRRATDAAQAPDYTLAYGKPHVGTCGRIFPPDVGTRRHTPMSGTSKQFGMRCSSRQAHRGGGVYAGEVFKNTEGGKNCTARLWTSAHTKHVIQPEVGTRRPDLPPHANT